MNSLSRGMLLLALLLAVSTSPVFAAVALEDHVTGCKVARVKGETSSPFVEVTLTQILTFQKRKVVKAKNGGFDVSIPFAEVPEGTRLRIKVQGALNQNGDSDGDSSREENEDCVAVSPNEVKCVSKTDASWKNFSAAYWSETQRCFTKAAEGNVEIAACLEELANLERPKLLTAFGVAEDAFDSGECASYPIARGVLDAPGVATSVIDYVGENIADVFDSPPLIADAVDDVAAAKCQKATVTGMRAIGETFVSEIVRIRKAAFERGRSQSYGGAYDRDALILALANGIENDTKLEAALETLDDALDAKCSNEIVSTYFACGGANTVLELKTCLLGSWFVHYCDMLDDAFALECQN